MFEFREVSQSPLKKTFILRKKKGQKTIEKEGENEPGSARGKKGVKKSTFLIAEGKDGFQKREDKRETSYSS